MADFPEPTTSRGCIFSGCINKLGIVIIILLIIGSWVGPAVFQDEIEARVCPEGSELKSYSRTTNGNNTTQGHACYSIETSREVKDLGSRLILPSILMTVIGILGIVFIIFASAMGSAQGQIATVQQLAGSGLRSRFPSSFSASQSPPTPNDDDLAERLQQLNEALNEGLITQDEYETKRQQIINNF